VPGARDPAARRFLGVRLTPEEEARLERYRADRGLANRSDAVRSLLRDADASRAAAVEIPSTRLRELEVLVEDGYFTSVASAVEHALEVELLELVANHHDGLEELRRRARELRERGDRRRRADREGRELLRR
jgi:Arc/MetJ-type ribon-helix-helix transcriptional regulator